MSPDSAARSVGLRTLERNDGRPMTAIPAGGSPRLTFVTTVGAWSLPRSNVNSLRSKVMVKRLPAEPTVVTDTPRVARR